MWVSRKIEIPKWEEVPSLWDRNNIYYIEYYIEVWSPARERNLEKVWRLRGWYLTIYTEKKNITWILSVKLRKCHYLLGGGYDFSGDTCISYCFFKLIQILNLLFDWNIMHAELIKTHKLVEVVNVDDWVKWYFTIGLVNLFYETFYSKLKELSKKSFFFNFFHKKFFKRVY